MTVLHGTYGSGLHVLKEYVEHHNCDDLAEALIRRDLMRVLQQSGDLAAASEHAVPFSEIAARIGHPGLSEMALRLNAHQEWHTRGMTAGMLNPAGH
jgi:hypothetical protein